MILGRVGAPHRAKLGWNWVDWAGKLFRLPAEPGSKNKWPFAGDFALFFKKRGVSF